jgi:CubicO group peptidase (beta-lactamase class C family)
VESAAMPATRHPLLSAAIGVSGLLFSLYAEPSVAQPVTPTVARASAAAPKADVSELQAALKAASAEAGTQGVLFGMWIGDKEILSTALGRSMTSVPAATDMHWRVGGFTEMFECTLLMMLTERGQIDLDQKISKWFPDLLAADQVTVRMLASCSAGYPDYVASDEFEARVTAEPYLHFSSEDLIAYAVKDGKMNYEPGTSQRYSHTEYVILGAVIERATGKSMKELYETNILTPEGLADTRCPTDQEIQPPVLHAFTKDRGVYEDCTYYNPSWGSYPGALTSNLHDMGRWGAIFGTGSLLSPESWAEMTAPTSVGKGKNQPDRYFCYGFAYSNGWYVQNPSMNGYSGGFAYNPANGVTLVVGATKNENPQVDPAGIFILKEMVKYVTPSTPLNF